MHVTDKYDLHNKNVKKQKRFPRFFSRFFSRRHAPVGASANASAASKTATHLSAGDDAAAALATRPSSDAVASMCSEIAALEDAALLADVKTRTGLAP